MRRFVLPLAALLALVVGTSTAKAQLIVATPYSGYYSAGYMAPSTSLYVAPSMGYYSSSYYPAYAYPSYTYSSYYATPYYGGYAYPTYSSSYYPSSYYGGYYGSYSPRWRGGRYWRW